MIITSSDIVLETFTERHICASYLGWLNDKDLMHYSEQRHLVHSKHTSLVYLKNYDQVNSYFWAIYLLGEGRKLVGTLTAQLDRNNNVCDIGILIGDRKVQGRGIGKKAWIAAMAYLFEYRSVRKITGGCMSSNIAVKRVMEGAGMRVDCIREKQFVQNGSEVDAVYFAIFRDEHTRTVSISVVD